MKSHRIPNHYRATLTFLGVFADAVWTGHSEGAASRIAEQAALEAIRFPHGQPHSSPVSCCTPVTDSDHYLRALAS